MSLERILKTLEVFGLSRTDSEVYIFLAKTGPKKRPELVKSLKISKQQLRLSLKNLENKGVINASIDQSLLFSALAFEEVLELLIRIRVDQAKAIKETKKELLKSWRSMKWH